MSAPGPWTVIVPVKSLRDAKSRLGPQGPELARAFLSDVLAAATACDDVARVVVASGDAEVGALARSLGADVVDDTGHPGINAAAAWAAASAAPGAPVAVVVSDLPCLTPDALAAVLRAADGGTRAFVPDASGEGTTMWLAAAGQPVTPRFGPSSAAAHAAQGDDDLVRRGRLDPAQAARARCDVDTLDGLRAAEALGLGARSRGVVAGLGLTA